MKSSNNLHRLFFLVFIIFSLLIGILLLRGDHTYPRVTETNITSEVLPLSTKQIILTFNRNMDQASVEANFLIEPKVEGKFSWIGKKMAYSFTEGLKPGTKFKVSLSEAKDSQGVLMKDVYSKTYRTSNQSLYFIGAQAEEKEKLIEFDLNTKEKKTLSPENLVIKDFKIHPDQNLIYLLGHLKDSPQQREDLYQLDLFTQKLDKIVDGGKEFIFSFDLSPDGKILLVRKAKVNAFDEASLVDPGSLWQFDIKAQTWSEFWNKEIYGNEFFFSPDSKYLVGRLITGDITILPVEKNPDKAVYLENYAGSYNLSPDGSKLVFVNFEDPFSPHDLLLRGNDGQTKTLVKGKGEIQFPIFNRAGDNIYFLLNAAAKNFEETGLLEFSPYHLYRYDLNQEKLIQLTTDENYFEGFFHVTSDGKKIAFERYKTSKTGAFFEAQLGEDAPPAEIWIYDQDSNEVKNLNLKGTKPYLN